MLPVLLPLQGCKADKQPKTKVPPLVEASLPEKRQFVDAIEAVGTARANEQVTIASAVTERIEQVLFDDNMRLQRGQLLVVLSKRQEDAALKGALAAEEQASAQYGRIKSLFDRGFATRAQLDLQTSAVERARADAGEARAAIGDRMIRAPFSGSASLRTISAGAVVSAGTPLVTVSDDSRIKLDFTVPETQLASLKLGQPVEVGVAAYPNEKFSGQVTGIDPSIDPASRAVMVRAILPNSSRRLKPGMMMTVRVTLGQRESDAVPELAVTGNGNSRFVFVVMPDGKARRITVLTGLREAGYIEVQGLPPRSKVIDEGVLQVADGIKVRLSRGLQSKRPKL